MLNIKSPIIFVDILGPLIPFNKNFELHSNGKYALDIMACDNLQRIVDKTGAVVVLSSIMCKHAEKIVNVIDFFFENGYAIPFIGTTRASDEGWRENEIYEWLEKHYVAHDCFIVIDDTIEDNCSLEDHLVAVNPRKGLTSEDADRAIALIENFRGSLDSVKNLEALARLSILKDKRR